VVTHSKESISENFCEILCLYYIPFNFTHLTNKNQLPPHGPLLYIHGGGTDQEDPNIPAA